MQYFRYTFAEHGRRDGYDGSVTAFYEITSDMSFVRSLEIFEDGLAYSFDQDHAADTFGILPDADMDVDAANEFGDLAEISKEDFEKKWKDTTAINRKPKR